MGRPDQARRREREATCLGGRRRGIRARRGIRQGAGRPRAKREGEEAAKRADRRARTEAIDLSLGLVANWFADVAAVAEGAPETISNRDRRGELDADARSADPLGARRSAELAMDTRRRLRVNVNEDLALDALFHRASGLLRAATLHRFAVTTRWFRGGVEMAAASPPPTSPVPPELPVTADRPAIQPVRKRRPFGVRLWLGLMFSAIGILTGATVYIVVSGSSESAAENRTEDLAVGRTLRVRENVEAQLPTGRMTKANAPVEVLRETRPVRTSAPGSTTSRRRRDSARSWSARPRSRASTSPPSGGAPRPSRRRSTETSTSAPTSRTTGPWSPSSSSLRRACRACCCRSPSAPRRSSPPCRRSLGSA